MARRSDPVTAYARGVKARKIVAGPWVRLACERHLRDLKEQKKRGVSWKPDLAQRAIDFFAEVLVLEDGRPFKLEAFQQFIVGSVFGWYRTDGFRRFRDAYVEIGKGNGKSPLAAGIGLYGLVADGESAPEVYSAATGRDQAKIVWKDADRMVEQSAELEAIIHRQVGSLTYGRGVFRPVSSEHKGLDGLRVHMGLIDELHEHPTAMVVDKIKAGTKRQLNALIFRITNSGFDRTSVCWKEHEYSMQVLQGTAENEAWFAYVAALDEGDDFLHDEKCWPKANPGMGTILPISYLRDQVASAVGMPSKENIVKRLNGCIWTEQEERWLDMAVWDGCGGAVNADALRGREAFYGLDMASRNDLCAEAKLFGPDEDGVYDLLMRFWIPSDTLDARDSGRSESDRALLREWADQGWIQTTDGNVTDYDTVESDVLKDAEVYPVLELAFDRWNITQLITHLKDALGDDRVVDYPQSFLGMSSPAKELEKILGGKKLRHGGNPVLRWMAANVALRFGPDSQVKPDREKSREKIDGIIALLMALGRAMVQTSEGPSVYETRGLVTA